ncbi:unnamed protein product [Tuber melanosporum]|uniref:(Perigord truffle) hypothetical protein n=1 Tax=Tuber melanosporum (strain Mel28) TaxID=656061 RepID=D5GFM7_TUBMM|nr:uncharacterized protein GSTUM_00006988001 [Tuber melanosporum]CAZ83320.1 unnamed protein product [Tuber melanosporum]
MAIVGSSSISSSTISAITENLGYKQAQRKKRIPCDLIRPHSKAYRKLGEREGRTNGERQSCIDTVFEGICYCAALPAAPLSMLLSG